MAALTATHNSLITGMTQIMRPGGFSLFSLKISRLQHIAVVLGTLRALGKTHTIECDAF
jgi:hypothetical protein